MSKNKNVSLQIKNGTCVQIRDSYLEHGKNTKGKHTDYRVATVLDSNRNGEIGIIKRQHIKNGLDIKNETYNPNIKTKNYKDEPLVIDHQNVRIIKTKKFSESEANELKRRALKEQPKNVRKPNKRRLRELKGRK